MSHKTKKNILIAFILNSLFSVFEFIGGFFTGSTAIISDAVHDLGDAISIGVSYFLEKKSFKKPDETFTYGYTGYSVIGGLITTVVLLAGSVISICHALNKIANPVPVNYNSMIAFAIVGVIINSVSAFLTHKGSSINQKAVNLHMLEDVMGWITVLVGAVIMKFTDISLIDPIMSIAIAVFIIINAIKNLKKIFDLFLYKVPDGISVHCLKKHIMSIDGVCDIHHIHIWSSDGNNVFATMHVITEKDDTIKDVIRKELAEQGITHATIETEKQTCGYTVCSMSSETHHGHHCHSHH